MLTVKTAGFNEALTYMEKQRKNVRFAAVRALTRTAVTAKREMQDEMKRVFDRPTRYTLNSIFIKPATKAKPEATVGMKNASSAGGRSAIKYLGPVMDGRARTFKGVEAVLTRRGLLPRGMFVVPGKGVRLDRSGNMTRNQIIKILNGIGKRGGQYFVGRVRGTHGVWQRKGKGVKPVLIFVRRPQYKKLLDFYKTAEDSFNKHFNDEFDRSLSDALQG